jgi:magnesium transporter
VQLFEYNNDTLIETENFNLIKFESSPNPHIVFWLTLFGISDTKPVEIICSRHGIHDLVIKDILDTGQKPKLQEFENYLQFSIKSVIPNIDKPQPNRNINFA